MDLIYIENEEFHKKYGRQIPGIDKLDDGLYKLTFDTLYLFLDLNNNDSGKGYDLYVPLHEAMDDIWTAERFDKETDMHDFQIFLDELIEEIKKRNHFN
jgi:hypothetical protein